MTISQTTNDDDSDDVSFETEVADTDYQAGQIADNIKLDTVMAPLPPVRPPVHKPDPCAGRMCPMIVRVCPADQEWTRLPSQCCPTCNPKPNKCATVRCSRIARVCPTGQEWSRLPEQCCSKCNPKADPCAGIMCPMLIRLCPKGQVWSTVAPACCPTCNPEHPIPLIHQFNAGVRAGSAPAAGAAPAGSAGATPAKVAGTQLTQDQAIAQLSKFDFTRSLEQYRALCNKDPSDRLACDPNWRRLNQQDLQALLQAKAMGITLTLPFIPDAPAGDYVVQDPFSIIPSGLPKQLSALIAMKNGATGNGANAAAAAAAAAQQVQAAADAAAADKAAKDAAAAQAAAAAQQEAVAAQQAAAAKQAADAAAAKKAADDAAAAAAAANDAAAAKAAADAQAKAKADADAAAAQQAAAAAAQAKAKQDADAAAAQQAAAAAAAAKAKADADAAAAAAAAAAANTPKVKRVGGLLRTPTNGHTLYFMNGESPQAIICTGGCTGVWTPADPSWGNDPSTGFANCAGFVRTDGMQQLQCDGKALYTFMNDRAAGQAGGHAFNPDFNNA